MSDERPRPHIPAQCYDDHRYVFLVNGEEAEIPRPDSILRFLANLGPHEFLIITPNRDHDM